MAEAKNIPTAEAHHALPILPLRDTVIFPHIVMPLFVGRAKSIKALEHALTQSKQIILVAQKTSEVEKPRKADLYRIGSLASVMQLLRLPDGTIKVLIESEKRVRIRKFLNFPEYMAADFEVLQLPEESADKIDVLTRLALKLFQEYVALNHKIPEEVLGLLSHIDNQERLVDTIAAHLQLQVAEKQKLLEAQTLSLRLKTLNEYLEKEIEVLEMEKRVSTRVRKQMEKTHKEYYLQEQMKAIQKELGDGSTVNECAEIAEQIKKAGMPDAVQEKANKELKKLKAMPPMAAEASVSRNYLDALLAVPWKKGSKLNHNLSRAEKILNQEHYGLEKIKERILEHLAVQNRVKKMKGPILCLVGPPGVGKTSLGQSIAHATGRQFVRMALGGMRDEAEIRGHRRTYIGALPGKIMYNLSKAGVRNPLFLLDEVDKMSMDFRGDPSAALLEVLDPEQNHAFNDHYLEVDYDLSEVMFVTTANTLDIPFPLRDRMEILQLSGYTEDEKLYIAKHHLLKKQRTACGLKAGELRISDGVILDVIRYYTREAGVRNLEREIAKICRKVVKEILLNDKKRSVNVTAENLEDYLGVRQYRFGKAEEVAQVGQVTGLAWTEMGGELLTIEAALMLGKGASIVTGQLGEIMQESIQAAMSVVRSRAENLGIAAPLFETNDVHVHVPEGAIPKDGPSAGIAMCVALISVFTNIPVRADVAMTGEITLRGEVLPIGGLKEKLLAARRGGIKDVIIPKENEKDLKEIPENIKSTLNIHPVRWIDEVLRLTLLDMPKPCPAQKRKRKKTKKALHQA